MKYFLSVIAFLVILIMSTKSFALDTQVKGFIALDLATIQQVQKSHTAIESGIGVLDLKVFAEQENMSAKLKLDLDDSDLSKPYNIFEEATVSYRYERSLKFTAGKGIVPFHRLHWGAMENSYIDGGNILGIYPYWMDVDQKLITSVRYNNQDLKFSNSLTFWGDSVQYSRDRDGNFYTTPATGKKGTAAVLSTSNSKTFVTTDEWGLANKFEFYPAKGWEASFSGIMYSHNLNPNMAWALDTGFGYENDKVEVWFETMYGVSSTPEFDKYTSFKKYDNTYQLGAEFYGTDLLNYVVNVEYASVEDNKWAENTFWQTNSAGMKVEKVENAKIDLAVKVKLAKTAHLTLGVMGEKQWKKRTYVDSTKNTDTSLRAGEAGAKLSFWF